MFHMSCPENSCFGLRSSVSVSTLNTMEGDDQADIKVSPTGCALLSCVIFSQDILRVPDCMGVQITYLDSEHNSNTRGFHTL